MVEVDFDGGEVASDTGLLFMRELESRLNLVGRVAGVLRDRRHSSYVTHQLVELMKQRVFQIIAGYEDGNDCDTLRDDPVLKMACERLPITGEALASQPTMCRFDYSTPEVFDFCDAHNIEYVLGLTPRKPMLQKASALIAKAQELHQLKGEPVKLFGHFQYQAASWAKPQRVIVKAEHNPKGANTRLIVTSLRHSRSKFIYQKIYADRGRVELMIKEHKTHLLSDRTSCSAFQANQFRLFLHSMAYIFLHAFRERHLAQTEFAKAQFNTIQNKILKVGARFKQLATKIKISLPSSFPNQKDFTTIWQSCCPNMAAT